MRVVPGAGGVPGFAWLILVWISWAWVPTLSEAQEAQDAVQAAEAPPPAPAPATTGEENTPVPSEKAASEIRALTREITALRAEVEALRNVLVKTSPLEQMERREAAWYASDTYQRSRRTQRRLIAMLVVGASLAGLSSWGIARMEGALPIVGLGIAAIPTLGATFALPTLVKERRHARAVFLGTKSP